MSSLFKSSLPNPNQFVLKGKDPGRPYAEVMDDFDLTKAVRIRNEYGKVRWLLSWYPQEDGFWLARLSCDGHPETIEALGQSRCLAIDSATRHLLHLLQLMNDSAWSDDSFS